MKYGEIERAFALAEIAIRDNARTPEIYAALINAGNAAVQAEYRAAYARDLFARYIGRK